MKNIENIKIAVVLRAGRAIIGMTQEELAQLLGIAKSTLARAETIAAPVKADIYFKALRIFKQKGVEIDPIYTDNIDIKVTKTALFNIGVQQENEERKGRNTVPAKLSKEDSDRLRNLMMGKKEGE